MDDNQDFSALRNLLALKRLEAPLDTNVDRFLIEFHRRQRAQLLVPASLWVRAMAWLGERASNFKLVPSISYATAFAAIAITAVMGLSQQVQVTHDSGGQYQLSLTMPSTQSSFAMIPASFGAVTTASKTDSLSFTPSRSEAPAATRFVLANNSHSAYDANMAF
ncbi:MAG: hypothetical protein LV481_16835 [Methylacidiphilales bacterium]|nr:hypothetical protein [Candidatus Methylacidiphilales bacterium]